MPNQKLSLVSSLNVNDIEFAKPEVNNIPGQKLSYQRVRIGVRKNGVLSDLIIKSPPSLLCWGLQDQRDQKTDELTGYQCPIVLWSNGTPSPEEKAFTDKFDEICDYVKEWIVENKGTIEKYDLEMSDLRKLNPLYWKMEKGVRVENKGPTLYAKCVYNKKKETIDTLFMDELNRVRVNPLSIIGKHCYVQFALKIESIYVGTKVSLQVKLQEVGFRLKDNSVQSLLFPEFSTNTVEKLEQLEDSQPLELLAETTEEEEVVEESDNEEEEVVEEEEESEVEEEVVEEEVVEEEVVEESEDEVVEEEPVIQKAVPVVPVKTKSKAQPKEVVDAKPVKKRATKSKTVKA